MRLQGAKINVEIRIAYIAGLLYLLLYSLAYIGQERIFSVQHDWQSSNKSEHHQHPHIYQEQVQHCLVWLLNFARWIFQLQLYLVVPVQALLDHIYWNLCKSSVENWFLEIILYMNDWVTWKYLFLMMKIAPSFRMYQFWPACGESAFVSEKE